MSRCARERRVFFLEEPVFDGEPARLEVGQRDEDVWVAIPHLPQGLSDAVVETAQRKLLDDLLITHRVSNHILWYYTPMAMGYTRHLESPMVIYDCMDELSSFKAAPPALKAREAELFRRANLVFTGGQSLYEAKRNQHPNIHAFPSSIDMAHFAQARNDVTDPADQADIPHPRLGYFGVVDERMDIELLAQLADARPDWHLVMIGPVFKIYPESLPQRANIHYLGSKTYKDLPTYLAGWDVALLPFMLNEHTRFISPTKTPEYLAGGKPVVSTPIRDVVRPYGEQALISIAESAPEFVDAIEKALRLNDDKTEWLQRVDTFLAQNSWDRTWTRMKQLIELELALVTHQEAAFAVMAPEQQSALYTPALQPTITQSEVTTQPQVATQPHVVEPE